MTKPSFHDNTAPLGPQPQYPIESVDNALKIILLLRDNKELRQRDVAEYLGVAGSTAHRLLAMLHYRGFLSRSPEGKSYRPGATLSTVAYSVLQDYDVRGVLRPILEALRGELLETVHLGTLEGANVRFIDALESPRPVRVASRRGQARPASSTATGKALLAQLPKEELYRIFPDPEVREVLPGKSLSRMDLEEELAQVRQQGFATSEEDNEDGVSSVASAIPRRSYPFSLAINVSLPVSRMAETELNRLTRHLERAVAEASKVLH